MTIGLIEEPVTASNCNIPLRNPQTTCRHEVPALTSGWFPRKNLFTFGNWHWPGVHRETWSPLGLPCRVRGGGRDGRRGFLPFNSVS